MKGFTSYFCYFTIGLFITIPLFKGVPFSSGLFWNLLMWLFVYIFTVWNFKPVLQTKYLFRKVENLEEAICIINSFKDDGWEESNFDTEKVGEHYFFKCCLTRTI